MELIISEPGKEELEEVDSFIEEEWKDFNVSRGYEYKKESDKLTARVNNELQGYISFETVGGVAYLSELIVSKKSRRLGIGRKLIEKFEETCKNKGCHMVYLETSEKHLEAVKFYEGMGYKRKVELYNFKFNFTWYLYTKNL